jgi:hypothetical protein
VSVIEVMAELAHNRLEHTDMSDIYGALMALVEGEAKFLSMHKKRIEKYFIQQFPVDISPIPDIWLL